MEGDKMEGDFQRFNMSGYVAPKIDTVRIGVVGCGNRGKSHLRTLKQIENVEIRALCDKYPENVKSAMTCLEKTDHTPEIYAGGENEWKKLCERKDIDLVWVCTPIPLHAPVSIYAMQQGKHVACEVSATWELDECWELVKTAEKTRKHFMMLENYPYMEFQLQALMMAKDGFFGDIIHGAGAYNTSKINNCFGVKGEDSFGKGIYEDWWWTKAYAERRGNIYPAHGLAPIALMMDINRGDSFDYLVSMESNDFNMKSKAQELAAIDPVYEQFSKLEYRGNMNSCLIRTVKGRSILLQHDGSTPQPHNLIHGIYGTKGCTLYDPAPPRVSTGEKWLDQEECMKIRNSFTPEIFRKIGSSKEGLEGLVHNGADILMNWHVIDCIRNGLPMPQDVYDAASWSCIMPLSEKSTLNRSETIDIPDFTNGNWKTNGRNMDINLENGGGNTGIIEEEVKPEVRDILTEQWNENNN